MLHYLITEKAVLQGQGFQPNFLITPGGLRVQVLFYILKEWGAPAKLSESFGLAQIAGAVEVRSPTGGTSTSLIQPN